LTKTFETETAAKVFARTKFDSGLIITAGTINPYLPRRAIPSGEIPAWLESGQAPEPRDREDAPGSTEAGQPSLPIDSNPDGHKS
jgi:hypothetical protein